MIHPLRIVLFSFPLLALLSGCSLQLVDETEVVEMSAEQFAAIREELTVADDPEVRAYIQCVTDAIVAELEPPYADLDWDLEIFDDEMVNAFAMPGGKIGVFTGLLAAAENQDQLAAVLGHEVAHVTEMHSLDRVNAQVWSQIAAQTAEIGGNIFLGTGGAGSAVGALADRGLLRPFGRSQETEADIVGLGYMADAGFEPSQSIQLWINMQREAGEGPPEFLSTHPSQETRIKDLNNELLAVRARYEAARARGRNPDCEP